jgi:hypothetical protein
MNEALKIAQGSLPRMGPRKLETIRFRGNDYIFDARLHELRQADGPGRIELRESESDMLDYALRAESVKSSKLRLVSAFMLDLEETGRVPE